MTICRDFIEELVFRIEPEWVLRYADAEAQILALPLSKQTGFVGWQLEVDEGNPADVRSIYYWASEDDYNNIDQEWLFGLKKAIGEAMPADKVRFIEARHRTSKRYRIRRIEEGSASFLQESAFEKETHRHEQ